MDTEALELKVYTSEIERNFSTVPSGNPWHKQARGAVRWGKNDFVLWQHGRPICPRGYLTLGGVSEEDAYCFVKTGKIPHRK